MSTAGAPPPPAPPRRRSLADDRELVTYRDLMKAPDAFEEGFGWATVAGALFVGFFMMPGSMYITLVAGTGLGPAATWVTIILFLEIAKRTQQTLKRQQIFILYYMAGMALASPFSGFLWNQYLVGCEAARQFGLTEDFPRWWAPHFTSAALEQRTFFHRDWLVPIILLFTGLVIGRIDHFGLGYAMYRITSDVEKLPFPMAPVGALGIMALADSSAGERESWRWRLFALGAMLGMVWGFLYLGLPTLTTALFSERISLIPIPWIDFTTSTEKLLPAVGTAVTFDAGAFLLGMVIPFWAVVGQFFGFVITALLNPLLVRWEVLHSWHEGMGMVDTLFSNNVDFYLSFGIGIALAIALVGFWHVYQSLRRQKRETGFAWKALFQPPRGRGDFNFWIAIGIYLFSTTFYTILCTVLVPTFPWYFLAFYGFIYTPLISYVCARMEGIAGMFLGIPYIREGGFIAAHKFFGYQGIDIWYAPIPLHNYGGAVVHFRTMELTGTSLRSVIKTEFMVLPIILVSSLLFAEFIWRMGPVPSQAYPYAQEMWDLAARNTLLMQTATKGGHSLFWEALDGWYILWGLSLGGVLYVVLALLGLPVLLVYGVVRGLDQSAPGTVFLLLAGALVGRFYFLRKYGPQWRQYIPVILAGFSCGVGLIGMVGVAVNLIGKAMGRLLY